MSRPIDEGTEPALTPDEARGRRAQEIRETAQADGEFIAMTRASLEWLAAGNRGMSRAELLRELDRERNG